MRAAALVALAGCAALGCGGSSSSSQCERDSQCDGQVCARDGECLPASAVTMAKLVWTIRGMPASATTCAQSPDFSIQFDADTTGEAFGFEPVPCQEGQFTIDKLPDRFDQVEMYSGDEFLGIAPILSGTATFDLAP